MKLTRAVEADPRHKAIETILNKDCRPLWEKSTLLIPHLPLTPTLKTCLKALLNRRQLERGLEHIDQVLGNEQKGLMALQKKQGTQPPERISRLLIISNDGSERFYRECEKTLNQHKDRVLLLCIDATSDMLTQSLMGEQEKDTVLKAVLVSDKDAVSTVLFSLVED